MRSRRRLAGTVRSVPLLLLVGVVVAVLWLPAHLASELPDRLGDLRYSLRDPTTAEQRGRLAVALHSTGFVETVVPDGRFYYRVVLREPHNPIAAEAVRRELRSSPAVDHVDSFADLVAHSLE